MTIFENQHGRVSLGFRSGLRRIGPRHLMWMRVGGIGHRRNIRLRSGAAAIENRWAALIVGVVGCVGGGIDRRTDRDAHSINSTVGEGAVWVEVTEVGWDPELDAEAWPALLCAWLEEVASAAKENAANSATVAGIHCLTTL